MNKFILFLLLSTPLFANTLELYSTQKQTTKGFSKFIYDPHEYYTHEDILNDTYKTSTTKIRTTYSDNVVWTKTTLANKTDKSLSFIFRNLRAGINKIDVYIYKGNSLAKTHHLGSLRDINARELSATKSIFHQTIEAHQEITLIIKHKSIGTLDLDWQLTSPREYSYTNAIELIFWGLFGGVVIALIIYNSSMFLTLRDNLFLFYVLHAFSVLIFNYALNGVLFLADLGINLKILFMSTWHTPILILIFLLLFTMQFFKLKENSKPLYALSKYLLISLFVALLFTFLLYVDSSIAQYTDILALHSFAVILFIFSIGIWAVYNKLTGALYFILGEGIYLFALTYMVLILAGNTSQSMVGIFIVPIAVTIEVTMLSLALGHKIRVIYQEAEKNKLLLHQQNEFTKLGKLVGSISHQWRQPINLISSEIMYLLLLEKKGQKDAIGEEFLKNAPKLQNTISYMSQTLDLFTNFYKPYKVDEKFFLKETLKSLEVLNHHELVLNNISFTVVCDEKLAIKTDKRSFLNIMMIFFENSIYELSFSNTENKQISISAVQQDTLLYLYFKDNAQNSTINSDKIFKAGSSQEKNSSGLGLKIAQQLAQTKLNASLSAYTQETYSVFELKMMVT